MFSPYAITAFRNILFGSAAMAALNLAVGTEPVVLQSTENQITLLELFTSEGCSSCPPAENWLTALKQSPALWKGFVPVAFHVDYWDYLGWRDPWGAKAFSERQRSYAQVWHNGSIYTPGFVLNGKEWPTWSGSKGVPSSSDAKVGVLKASSADLRHWEINFAAAKQASSLYEVRGVLLESGLISDVKAGENRGRRLEHDFVAIVMAEGSLRTEGDRVEGQLVFNDTGHKHAGRLALAIWISRNGSLEPIQAVGGWLP